MKNSSLALQQSSLTYFHFISNLETGFYCDEKSLFPIYNSRIGSSLYSWKGQKVGIHSPATHTFCYPLSLCMDGHQLPQKPRLVQSSRPDSFHSDHFEAHSTEVSSLNLARPISKQVNLQGGLREDKAKFSSCYLDWKVEAIDLPASLGRFKQLLWSALEALARWPSPPRTFSDAY